MIKKKTFTFIAALACLAATSDTPKAPHSPKATDALRIDASAITKATRAYWQACAAAEQRLLQQLRSAADVAHGRNDGDEEQACLEAAKDVKSRYEVEAGAISLGYPAEAVKPLRFEDSKAARKK